jgi:hypothetical protein
VSTYFINGGKVMPVETLDRERRIKELEVAGCRIIPQLFPEIKTIVKRRSGINEYWDEETPSNVLDKMFLCGEDLSFVGKKLCP